MALTPEQKEILAARLAKGRATVAANRKAAAEAAAAKAAAPDPTPVAMPPIAHEDTEPAPLFDDGTRPEPDPNAIDEPQDDFERFLAVQDSETRAVLSDMELRVIYETEAKRAADERKAALKKAAALRAARHARATAGLIPAEAVAAQALRDRLSQKVSWIVNMPEAGNSGTLIDAGVRINGVLYVHGSTVTGTLGEYISYREIEARAHENERQFQGRSRMSKLAQTGMRFLNNEGHA
jgi:membrane protein involved in colicin uptake